MQHQDSDLLARSAALDLRERGGGGAPSGDVDFAPRLDQPSAAVSSPSTPDCYHCGGYGKYPAGTRDGEVWVECGCRK